MRLDQLILGDNVPFVDVAEKLAEARTSADLSEFSSVDSFRMVPATSAAATCRDVLAPGFFQ